MGHLTITGSLWFIRWGGSWRLQRLGTWNLIDKAAVSSNEMHSIEYAFEGFSLELSEGVSANHIQLLWIVSSAGYLGKRQKAGRRSGKGRGRGAPVSCPADGRMWHKWAKGKRISTILSEGSPQEGFVFLLWAAQENKSTHFPETEGNKRVKERRFVLEF